jgi:Flp pilus assembly protein TadD
VDGSLAANSVSVRVGLRRWSGVGLLALGIAASAGAQDLAKCERAVVEVRPRPAGNPGTVIAARVVGFFVDLGHLVTDARALRSSDRASVLVGSKEYAVTAVLAEDAGASLVLVAVDLPDGAPPALPLAPGIAAPGDAVTLVAPGIDPSVARGTISSFQEVPGFGTVFRTTIPVPAPIGAPAVDAAGRVVGIASALVPGAPTADFFVATPHLRAMQRLRPVTLADWESIGTPAPAHDEAGYREAVRLSLDGHCEAALPRLEQLLQANPRDTEAQVASGICLEAVGRREDAVEAYKRALTLDPSEPRTWYRLGVTQTDLSRWQDAVNSFSRALLLRPDDPHSHYNLGLAYGALGRLQQEADEYSNSIRLDPEHSAAYNNLGVVYIALKRYADAVVALSRAVRLSPGSAESRANLGVAYADLGQLEEGATALREAVRLAPDSPKAHYALGVVLAAEGDSRGAAAEQQLLERLDPQRARQLASELARRRAASRK